MQVHVCMHQCTLAVKCISVLLSDMSVLSGGWFLHRIGISIYDISLYIIHVNLQFEREKPNAKRGEVEVCIRFVFPVQNEGWHVLYIMINHICHHI